MYRNSDNTDRIGVAIVAEAFERIGFAFREQPTSDFGIDAQVELRSGAGGAGQLIALQIKSGPSYFREEASAGWWLRTDGKHADYWLAHALPVVVVQVDVVTRCAFWAAATDETVLTTGKGAKILIPEDQHVDHEAVAHLTRLFTIGTSPTTGSGAVAVAKSMMVWALNENENGDPFRWDTESITYDDVGGLPTAVWEAVRAQRWRKKGWLRKVPEPPWAAPGRLLYRHEHPDQPYITAFRANDPPFPLRFGDVVELSDADMALPANAHLRRHWVPRRAVIGPVSGRFNQVEIEDDPTWVGRIAPGLQPCVDMGLGTTRSVSDAEAEELAMQLGLSQRPTSRRARTRPKPLREPLDLAISTLLLIRDELGLSAIRLGELRQHLHEFELDLHGILEIVQAIRLTGHHEYDRREHIPVRAHEGAVVVLRLLDEPVPRRPGRDALRAGSKGGIDLGVHLRLLEVEQQLAVEEARARPVEVTYISNLWPGSAGTYRKAMPGGLGTLVLEVGESTTVQAEIAAALKADFSDAFDVADSDLPPAPADRSKPFMSDEELGELRRERSRLCTVLGLDGGRHAPSRPRHSPRDRVLRAIYDLSGGRLHRSIQTGDVQKHVGLPIEVVLDACEALLEGGAIEAAAGLADMGLSIAGKDIVEAVR
jgi:hypothetical protein